jgi:hypothetical protein
VTRGRSVLNCIQYILLYSIISFIINHFSGVMVSVLASSAVDRGCEPGRVKQKTIKLVFVASPLSTQHEGERAKTDWLGVRIMCPSRATCLPVDCCFSELAL